jgi:hypothetical protein
MPEQPFTLIIFTDQIRDAVALWVEREFPGYKMEFEEWLQDVEDGGDEEDYVILNGARVRIIPQGEETNA